MMGILIVDGLGEGFEEGCVEEGRYWVGWRAGLKGGSLQAF